MTAVTTVLFRTDRQRPVTASHGTALASSQEEEPNRQVSTNNEENSLIPRETSPRYIYKST